MLKSEPKNQLALNGLHQLNQSHRHADLLLKAEQWLAKNESESAKNNINQVLAEDAQNAQARLLFERIEQSKTEQLMTTPQLKSAFKKPITVEFKAIPLRTIFDFIAKISDINFSFDQDFKQDQPMTILARNSSVEDIIQTILTTNQLEKKVINANTVLIYPRSRSANYQEMYVRSFYLGNLDAKRAMNLLKTVTKAKDIYIDEKLNTLVMRDTPETIHLAEKLIASQDLPDPEVMLEVQVMEVSRKSLEDIGIQYPTQVSLGVRGTSTGSLTSGQLSLTELKNFNGDLGVFSITNPALTFNLLN